MFLSLFSCQEGAGLEGKELVSMLLNEKLVGGGFSSVTEAKYVRSNCRTPEVARLDRKNCPLWKVYNEDNQSLY